MKGIKFRSTLVDSWRHELLYWERNSLPNKYTMVCNWGGKGVSYLKAHRWTRCALAPEGVKTRQMKNFGAVAPPPPPQVKKEEPYNNAHYAAMQIWKLMNGVVSIDECLHTHTQPCNWAITDRSPCLEDMRMCALVMLGCHHQSCSFTSM